MTGDPLDAYFDRPWRVARKLETGRTVVAPGEAERIQAFERGEPRPVRSVRTTPYLARVAVTTVTEGRVWERIRLHDRTLTPYQRYGIPGLIESQAAGEIISVVVRAADLSGDELREDFWWFDPGQPGEFGIALDYDPAGVYLGAREVTDEVTLDRYADDWDLASRRSVSLNEYLASTGLATRVA